MDDNFIFQQNAALVQHQSPAAGKVGNFFFLLSYDSNSSQLNPISS